MAGTILVDLPFGGLDERGESILSTEEEERNEQVMYGDLLLSIAPKENKANTLLASSLFSPSFFIAEQIEVGLLPVAGKTVLELGAGAALPSLLLSTLPKDQAPSLIVTTDYPDDMILGNVNKNVERNTRLGRRGVDDTVRIAVEGYKWGDDPLHVLKYLDMTQSTTSSTSPSPNFDAHISNANPGFDILILSDLLHFDQSHFEIIKSIVFMLKKNSEARVYVVAGKYTRREICESFLKQANCEGLVWEEFEYGEDEESGLDGSESRRIPKWRGVLPVRIGKRLLTEEELVMRRENCWGWVGRWVSS